MLIFCEVGHLCFLTCSEEIQHPLDIASDLAASLDGSEPSKIEVCSFENFYERITESQQIGKQK